MFAERALPVEVLKQGKLVELMGDITVDRLGLETSLFEEVCLHRTWITAVADMTYCTLSAEGKCHTYRS